MAEIANFDLPTAAGPRTVALNHRRGGSGEPVLLLHGIGHRLEGWDPVFRQLASQHEVIAVDLPGFGASPRLPDGLPDGPEKIVKALGAFCRDQGIERPHVVGNSLGGLLALEMARAGLARSVTALSPAGFFTEIERRWAFLMLGYMRLGARVLPLPLIRALSRSTVGRYVLTGTVYARPSRVSPEAAVGDTLAFRNAVAFKETLKAGAGLRLTEDLPGVPVTIAWGSKDRLLLPRQGARAKRVMPDARLVRLPGCGHTPMSDDPALVTRVILDGAARGSVAATGE